MRPPTPFARNVALLLIALIAGCSNPFSPGRDTKDLDAARETWRTHGYASYEFTFRRSCFCGVTDPLRVRVVNDTVVSVVLISTNAPIDKSLGETVEGLFRFIQRGIDNDAAELRVTYDATLGYPREIVYDGSRMIADDEVTFTAKDVVSIPR